MTCILGVPGRFICADRRISEDGGAVSSLIKVASNPWVIAAAAGLAATTYAVKRAVRAGAESAEDLVQHVDPGSCALVLSWDGRLAMISERTVWPCREVTAIGSGSDLALGYLADRGYITSALLRRAQRFVAKRRADCGGGCDVRGFG